MFSLAGGGAGIRAGEQGGLLVARASETAETMWRLVITRMLAVDGLMAQYPARGRGKMSEIPIPTQRNVAPFCLRKYLLFHSCWK